MLRTLTLARRFARFRALLLLPLAFAAACDSPGTVDPDNDIDPEAPAVERSSTDEVVATGTEMASASFVGGIPFGMSAQPVSVYGSKFSGGKATISPGQLLENLSAIRSRGGKVILMLAGHPRDYTDANGYFSLTKWKNRINLFKGISFKSYIDDGTVVGHFLLDEPQDKRNWNGRTVSPSTVEEMARYSKSIWPNMPTLIRAHPDYMLYNHRYLDGAWATYMWRRGDANEYTRQMVAEAQKRDLSLVVGLNVLDGGNPTGTKMTAQELENWGSAMLSSSYPCAFVMWKYDTDYLTSSGVPSAMDVLRRKAANRSTKSCRS